MSYQYYDGIPTSLIAYSTNRGRLQTFENVYDLQDNTSLILQQLQSQISELQSNVSTLFDQVSSSGIVSVDSNLIANANMSQWSLAWPINLTSGASNRNNTMIMQGFAQPIMDRWYHVAELSGFNPTGFKCTIQRVLLTSYIPGGSPPEETYPHRTKYGMRVSYYNVDNAATPVFSLEHLKPSPDGNKFGGMIAIQHTLPDVTRFAEKTFNLGFWLRSDQVTGKGYIRLVRQYRPAHTGPGGFHTQGALETVYLSEFDTVFGWNYITANVALGPLNGSFSLLEGIGNNGFVIQIGPINYYWTSAPSQQFFGDVTPFTKATPGLDWIFAEVQARIDDVIPTEANFILRDDERDRTSPYMTVGAHLSPEEIRAYSPLPGAQYLPSGTVRWVSAPSDGMGGFNQNLDIFVPIILQDRLLNGSVTANSNVQVFLCTYNKANLSPSNFVRFVNEDTVSQGGIAVGSWGTADFTIKHLAVSVHDDTDGQIAVNNSAPTSLRVSSMGNANFELVVRYVHNTSWGAELWPGAAQVYFTPGGGDPDRKYIYFVAFVRETPDHLQALANTENLTLVDHSWTAITSRLIGNNN